MDHTSIFSELSYIIAIATGVALIMRLFKQPLIIGHIITGIIVGPSVLDIAHSEDSIEAFATFGIALLLFIIGLGLNPKIIKELGKVSTITGGSQVLFTALLSLGLSIGLGYTFQEAIFIGIGLAFSSTIIILKLISDKKEQTRLYGKLAIGILLIQDIIATLALLFLSATGGSEGSIQANDFGVLLVKGAVVITLLFLVSSQVLKRTQKFIAGSQEFLFLFALGWGLGSALIFEKIGFSLEVGALVAGISLATLPYAQEMGARLRPLRDFFIILFFISLGSGLSLDSINSVLGPALVLSMFVVIFNPIIIMVVLGLLGYTKRTSFKTALAMAQVSEFSLIFLVLAERTGYVSIDIISLMTVVAFITIFISSYLIIYTDELYMFFEQRFKMFEHKKVELEQSGHNFSMLLFGYQKGGNEFVKLFKSMGKKFAVVDYDPEVIDTLTKKKVDHIYGDATDIELLEELGIEKTRLVVSMMTDHSTNVFLLTQVLARNPKAVVIAHSDTPEEATELYEHGATYVMMPHYLGSEKIGSFIKRNGFNKKEFKKYRDKHLVYVETHVAVKGSSTIGNE